MDDKNVDVNNFEKEEISVIFNAEKNRIKVYLDNCCYCRPYDDQSGKLVQLETEAKLEIQRMIKDGQVCLITSATLDYEISKNPNPTAKDIIQKFTNDNAYIYVSKQNNQCVRSRAERIIAAGIGVMDANHIASSIIAGSDYFITVDKRLLKYRTGDVIICDPIKFLSRVGGEY